MGGVESEIRYISPEDLVIMLSLTYVPAGHQNVVDIYHMVYICAMKALRVILL